jgi:hypothetical protein
VAPAPHSLGHDHELSKAPLLLRGFANSVRAFDAPPARETLMNLIMLNATAPVGYASDLERLKH